MRVTLLVVTDPRADHQPLIEASYAILPTIALGGTDFPLCYVDTAIPCNNSSLSGPDVVDGGQEVTHVLGTISCKHPWEIIPDLYFYKNPKEIEKKEQAVAEKAVTKEEFQGAQTSSTPEFTAI
ncbi:hypothetical protein P7K49_004686 [Saguinus oedipus]|uniref:40S ribosomal protein SA n=1 Tax=Saguinus oedipus TaxID=9490 RepID=A0ABQ9W840_SAGOE|nr:hypothetical protein P7K49_004686 [Saguinus oedipus]